MNEQIILDTIHPDKDADGFHPVKCWKTCQLVKKMMKIY